MPNIIFYFCASQRNKQNNYIFNELIFLNEIFNFEAQHENRKILLHLS